MQPPGPLPTRDFCDCHIASGTRRGAGAGLLHRLGRRRGLGGTQGLPWQKGSSGAGAWGITGRGRCRDLGFPVPVPAWLWAEAWAGSEAGEMPPAPQGLQPLPDLRLRAGPGTPSRAGASWLPVPGPGRSRANLPMCCSGWRGGRVTSPLPPGWGLLARGRQRQGLAGRQRSRGQGAARPASAGTESSTSRRGP